ncbi:unnamed protein product [Pleuronectes platessa]|uniref:Membrane protein FAM174B n=1 Tax=Pleuronectes platessa TaxID=8262 RepID=A0A9N7Y7M2_PLEPL|nr:unnamed protein product [Pleuronectes platessa]
MDICFAPFPSAVYNLIHHDEVQPGFDSAHRGSVAGQRRTSNSPLSRDAVKRDILLLSSALLSEHEVTNVTDDAVGSRISSLMTHLPTLKNIVIFICVLTAALITCLVIKVIRSGRRIRKTRKYDIITTPAERVEMAPLNEENDDDDDSTLFDVKYR